MGAVIVGVLVLVELGCIVMLYVAARAARFRGFWQRNYVQMRLRDPGLTAVAFARQAIPLNLLVMAIVGMCLPVGIFGAGAVSVPITLGLLGAVVVAGVLLLFVGRTGRPRALVLAPFRGVPEDDAARWLLATYVFELAMDDPPGRVLEVAVCAGDRAEAVRRLRSAGVSRTELSVWTRPSRILNVGEPEYVAANVLAWRPTGDATWISWEQQPPW
jgi:hypothetical protein